MDFVMTKKSLPNIFAHVDFKGIGKEWFVFRLYDSDIYNGREVFNMFQQHRKPSYSKVV